MFREIPKFSFDISNFHNILLITYSERKFKNILRYE